MSKKKEITIDETLQLMFKLQDMNKDFKKQMKLSKKRNRAS